MKRSEIRDFLKDGVEKINPQLHFGSGRLSEWNSKPSKTFPQTWWESIVEDNGEIVNHILPVDTYPIQLHIGKLDKTDSSHEEYEAIVDECHYTAQQLIYQYNQVIVNHTQISIEGFSREPFVKKHADCITGVILKFSLKGPDKTKLC